MSVKEGFSSVTEFLEKAISAKTVVGEAQQFGDVTLVPVVDLAFGYGGGSGEGSDKENGGGAGVGGGAGAKMTARAIIVINKGEVSVLPLTNRGTADKLIEAVPGLVEKLVSLKGSKPAAPEAPAADAPAEATKAAESAE